MEDDREGIFLLSHHQKWSVIQWRKGRFSIFRQKETRVNVSSHRSPGVSSLSLFALLAMKRFGFAAVRGCAGLSWLEEFAEAVTVLHGRGGHGEKLYRMSQ